jgi:hypothetical protein
LSEFLAIDRNGATARRGLDAVAAFFPLILNTLAAVEPVARWETMSAKIDAGSTGVRLILAADSLTLLVFAMFSLWKRRSTLG